MICQSPWEPITVATELIVSVDHDSKLEGQTSYLTGGRGHSVPSSYVDIS